MCGRFVRVPSVEEIASSFVASHEERVDAYSPGYNVAPSQMIPVVTGGDNRRVADSVWGIAAAWKPSTMVINARMETIHEKPMFKHLIGRGRCIVPMSGYYEWLTNEQTKRSMNLGSGKIPFFITAAPGSPLVHGRLLAAAGLLRNVDGRSSCVLLTRRANESVSNIHDRMPVLLDEEAIDEWLSTTEHPEIGLLEACGPYDLAPRRANTRVNNVRNQGPDLLEPEEPETLF